MEGVKEVNQLDDTHLRWKAQIGGKNKQWNAVITEQRPDERIAWKSTDGAKNAGVVTFHRLSDQKSKVMLQMDYEPEGTVENVGDAVGAVSTRVAGDLERFKTFIESRGQETGALERPGETEQDLAYCPYLHRPHSRYREQEAGGSQFPKKRRLRQALFRRRQGRRFRLTSRRVTRSSIRYYRRSSR
jgi:hypothetical protein